MKSCHGVGLGLRKPFQQRLLEQTPASINFLELAPENWMGAGGARAKYLKAILEKYPIICHGLSLSIGGPAPLDIEFVKQVKKFVDDNDMVMYSEHLSYTGDEGHLYDLIPLPFTEDAIQHVVSRVQQVQDIMGSKIALENISYYLCPSKDMSEVEFINEILSRSGCDLLLDVNNVYVNSVNHHYDPAEFIRALKPNHVAYIHIAGHNVKSPDLIIDTHGEDVIDPVWDLLRVAYDRFGLIPTLLERDSNIPPLEKLLQEIDFIHEIRKEFNRASAHA